MDQNLALEAKVSRITIYPIKSLDGISLEKAIITDGGCLLHDREYVMQNEAGQFVIGKSNPLVHSLRSSVDFEKGSVAFRHQDEAEWKEFHFVDEKKEIETYLSHFFKTPIVLLRDKTGRFLDVPDLSGITVLSTASLEEVSQWFGGMDLDETRRRFRATIESEGVPAFWEDALFSSQGFGIEFKIGNVRAIGVSPRARCVVPTRNTMTGEQTPTFPKSFGQRRAAHLPVASKLSEYGHYYYLSVDCYLPASEVGKWIAVGDKLEIVRERALR